VKLLYICHRLPFPPNRGGKIRPFQMIQHLSKSHEVTVASLAHTAQELQDGNPLQNHCSQLLAEVVPDAARWRNAVLALPGAFPSSAAYFHSARLGERIHEVWNASRYDGVLVHCAFAAQYALPLRGGFRIMDYGDLDSAKWSDYAAQRVFPLSAAYALESAKLRRFEKLVAESSTHCTFTTRGECDSFRLLGVSKPLAVIPNGVDAGYFRRKNVAPADSKVIVFLGRMDYFPNVDGIRWFAKELFGAIRSRVPAAKLRIVGANPVRAVKELEKIPGVTVTGFVPDVRPHVHDAAVAIAPLRLARGTQNKILECMSMGIAVVSTPEAARGIQAREGEHLAVGNTPQEFIELTAELLLNPKRRLQLAEAGRLQVESAHQWAASMRVLDEVLRSVSS
jgi:sugar transferase (PEP-CTERM/EpsH1 system associated)